MEIWTCHAIVSNETSILFFKTDAAWNEIVLEQENIIMKIKLFMKT
jgi:hypothetical protein